MQSNTTLTGSQPMDRRRFLKLSGLLGLGFASAAAIPPTAEAVLFNRNLTKVSSTRLGMGTFVSMTLIHPSRDKAQEAMELAFSEIDRLTAQLSRFNEATAVAQLNREGALGDIPHDFTDVVRRALDYHRITGGAFDISVKPVVDLFRECFAEGKGTGPSDADLERVVDLVGANNIELKERAIRFKKPGMGITLDGIAKGFIVDRAADVLSDHKIDNYLINAGGDIRTKGARNHKRPWTVAIQDPLKKGRYPDTIHMTDGAVATSGNYEIYFDHEKMFHHIVDPATGLSPQLSTSVSVFASTAMDADALSTSVFIMKPEKGARFIDTLPQCECLVVTRDGNKVKSLGWKSAAI